MSDDPFTAAIDGGMCWSSDDDAGAPDASDAAMAGGDIHVTKGVPRDDSVPVGAVKAARKTTMRATLSNPRRTKKKAAHVISKLRKLEPGADPSLLWTVFMQHTSAKSRTQSTPTPNKVDRKPRRLRSDDHTPVPIWPLYEIDDIDGNFVVISPHEAWVANMIHVLRPPSDTRNSATCMRTLKKNLRTAVNVMLRKALKSPTNSPIECSDHDFEATEKAIKRGSRSGFPIANAFLLKTYIGEYPISLANYGRQMIALMDADATRFINSGLVVIIGKLSDTPDDAASPDTASAAPETAFRFDDSTPNIFGKVVWDVDQNGWRISYKATKQSHITYADCTGRKLLVPSDLGSVDHMRTKASFYKHAIDTWNALDKTTRKRITPPLTITLDTSGSPAKALDIETMSTDGDDSLTLESPASLHDKWMLDTNL